MAENEVNEPIVERMLMKFEDIPNRDKLKVNVFVIDIDNVGSWVLKFRKTGVIVNNRDLIISVVPDATIQFKSFTSFSRMMGGGSTINEEIAKGQLTLSGPTEALESFHSKWLRLCDLTNTVNADIPTRSVRLPSLDKIQPLKAGWLLKKRDIFSGWRCRYFVVYPDRLEYFIDQYDATPKATMSLIDVEVQSVKRVNMPGVGEHWGIIVTTKNPKSTFRLASEMTGIEGMVECSTWEKVFSIARQSCEQYLENIVSDSEQSKAKRLEEAQASAESARQSVRIGNSGAAVKNLTAKEKVAGWYAYLTSKQGAPRVLLCLGLVVLLVRIFWNVTKIRVMFRNILFHSVVAVLVLVILFFLKSIFTEYFTFDDAETGNKTAAAAMSTIAPSAAPSVTGTGTTTATPSITATTATTSTASVQTSVKLRRASTTATPTTNTITTTTEATGTQKKERKRLFNFGRGGASSSKSSTSGTSSNDNPTPRVGANDSALRRSGSPSMRSLSKDGSRYGGISPLPPHVITTKPSHTVGIAESVNPMNTNTMRNVTNATSDDS